MGHADAKAIIAYLKSLPIGWLANFAKRRPRVLQIFRERFEALICERMPEELLENFERHRADAWETFLWLLGLVVC